MLLHFGLIVLGAIVGIAQVAAIRRLLSRRAEKNRGLTWLLLLGGTVMLVVPLIARLLTDGAIVGWLVLVLTFPAATAILIGVALLEANKLKR